MKGRRNLNEEGERIYIFYFLTIYTAHTAEGFQGVEGLEGAIGADWAIGAKMAMGSKGVMGAAIYILLDG